MCLSGCSSPNSSSSNTKSTAPPAATTTTTTCCASCPYSTSGGTLIHSDVAVEVRTGVVVSAEGRVSADDTIEIRVKCKNNPHVLQFLHREIFDASGKRIGQTLNTTSGTQQTTTDPTKPAWLTDSASKPDPYYETGGLSCACPDELIVWDQPGLLPSKGQVWKATFQAFIICNGKVVRRVDWVRSQTFGGAPSYTASVTAVSSLPKWALDTMKAQGYTYP